MDDTGARRVSAGAFENETFEKLDLGGADLSGKEFIQCTFRNSKMQETAWIKSRLEDCVFDGCDLTSLRPKGMALRGVEFAHCKLLGVAWADVGAHPMVGFTDCAMRYQTFVSIKLRNTRFLRCSILESTFVDVDVTKSIFEDCDLTKTLFERCELTQADFSSSRGVYFDTTKNRTKGARVSVETAAFIASALGLHVTGYSDSD